MYHLSDTLTIKKGIHASVFVRMAQPTCGHPPLLHRYGIAVDQLTPTTQLLCLTHAHQDHWSFLREKLFLSRPTLRVLCSRITRDMILCVEPHWKSLYSHRFHLVEDETPEPTTLTNLTDTHPLVFTWYKLFPSLYTGVRRSIHCPGSLMFFFLGQPQASIPRIPRDRTPVSLGPLPDPPLVSPHTLSYLFTGDFRWFSTHSYPSPYPQALTGLFIDNTMRGIQTTFPTFQKVEHDVLQLMKNHPHVYVNASVLGFEIILQSLCQNHRHRIWLHPSVQHHARGCQIRQLLGDYIQPTAKQASLWLYHRSYTTKHPLDAHTPRLLPSATQFLCQGWSPLQGCVDMPQATSQARHVYVCFSSHASEKELKQFCHVWRTPPTHIFACEQDIRNTLYCLSPDKTRP